MTTIAVPSSATAQLGRVTTIGYHQPQAWQIVTHMVYEQGWSLVDIRYSRRSYLDEWSGSSLLRHFRQSYHAVPELGDVNQLAPAHPMQLLDPTTGLAKVGLLLEAGMDCLLVCACPDWRRCHRRLVASLLQQVYPALEVTHLVPDTCAVDLPPWCFETVALLQRYGLLRPLPHAPQEQPVLLRTNTSQGVLLPGYGECTLSLSVCLWLPPPATSTGNNDTVAPAQDEHELHPSTAAASASKEHTAMTDHQQRRYLPRQQPPQVEGEDWYDEQDGGAPIEDEVWPPRTRTSAVRYQTTTQGTPAGTSLVRMTTTSGRQRMQGLPARRTATHQRLLPGGRYEQEPLSPPRRGGHIHVH